MRDILREMMLYGDGATVSGKKDFLINIGGLLAFKDNASGRDGRREAARLRGRGAAMAACPPRDLAAMARGIEEMLDDRYIRSRVEQSRWLAERLQAAGVPDRRARRAATRCSST